MIATADKTLSIPTLLRTQRAYFASGATREYKFRKEQLEKLKNAISKHESAIFDALKADLNKPAFEAYGTEVGFVIAELDSTLANLNYWMKPRPVSSPMFAFKAKSYIQPDPRGTVLIISPWNYPFQLLIAPLVGCIAAGNTCILKPSELAPNTSAAVSAMIRETFNEEYIAIVEGGIETSESLLQQRYDYIFFTGGTEVGRKVYMAAAKHLTPVTLELGGKSPCVIDKDVNIDLAAKRIVWGKYINAGQTCIAPDYILIHKDIKDRFIRAFEKQIEKAYSENPEKSNDYCRIINDRHFQRLKSYLKDGNIAVGGETNAETRYIAPTVLTEVAPDSSVMQEEIFGPILPILEINNIDEAIDFINNRAKPLALYVFSNKDRITDRVLSETSSGGACVNDTLMHIANGELPFGGVGDSGIGGYHGQSSFDLFSHLKSVLNRSTLIDPPMRYAPYKIGLNTLKTLMKWTLG